MGGSLQEGALVSLTGQHPKAQGPDHVDVTGHHGKLLRFNRQTQRWRCLTFSGDIVDIPEADVRLLEAHELPPEDFILGDVTATMAEEMASKLIFEGYFTAKSLSTRENSLQMRQAASQDLQYVRVPSEFEPYYLGRDSREKTCLIDFEDKSTSTSLSSTFRQKDELFSNLFTRLSPLLKDKLGMRLTARTNLLVRQTFEDDEEEASFPASKVPTDGERESIMKLMKRRRVCIMEFVGPLTGKLLLLPRKRFPLTEISIEAVPGRLVAFSTEKFRYSFTCNAGTTTTLQTWLLSQSPQFILGAIGGDMSVLGAVRREQGPQPPQGDCVAVTGVSTFLGCDSKDYACYWLMFAKAGGDTFVQTPISRWDINEYCVEGQQAAQAEGKSYTVHQGYVDGIELFDAKFFGLGQSEAAAMDPNQRKTLELCYSAANMAGYDLKALQRDPKHIGVFVGISGSEWNNVPHPRDAAGCGSAEAIISNRVNFSLNLKGASQTINTACSSGLVAMHSGKLHLIYKDFDPLDGVLCCGTQLAYSPYGFIGCCSGGMLSLKGRCFTYDKTADGYGRGEGVSCVYMSMAPFSQDVFALVAGSQANQDGRSASLTAPNGPAQEKCIRAVFREAKLQPPEIDCFECHGTGTALGDPIEVGAFRRIYSSSPRSNPLLVTSSKTNLGHLEGGAGMAGFIKCVLQVMRAECGPNIHLRVQNPHLDLEGFPALLMSDGLCCAFDSALSGVSSFGFGGTNAHAMAFGKNFTSNRRLDARDYRMLMMQKILQANPPMISKPTSDPEAWESSGAPLSEDKIGTVYQVEIDSHGQAVWRQVVETPPDIRGNRFGISGSFNGWQIDSMTPIERIPGLFGADVMIGSGGQEFFHLLCDEDPSQIYHPAEPRCTRKLARIVGPVSILGRPEDHAWCIVGKPGSRYRVELHITKKSLHVTWLRVKED